MLAEIDRVSEAIDPVLAGTAPTLVATVQALEEIGPASPAIAQASEATDRESILGISTSATALTPVISLAAGILLATGQAGTVGGGTILAGV